MIKISKIIVRIENLLKLSMNKGKWVSVRTISFDLNILIKKVHRACKVLKLANKVIKQNGYANKKDIHKSIQYKWVGGYDNDNEK